MAVRRAWVNHEGRVINQLSKEQMKQFTNKLTDGLQKIAVQQVIEERKRENRAVSTAEQFC